MKPDGTVLGLKSKKVQIGPKTYGPWYGSYDVVNSICIIWFLYQAFTYQVLLLLMWYFLNVIKIRFAIFLTLARKSNNATTIFQVASFCLPILLAIVLFAVLCCTMKKYKQFEYDILRSEDGFEICTSFLRQVISKSITKSFKASKTIGRQRTWICSDEPVNSMNLY